MPIALVVRHGRASGNTLHRFIGQSDVALDDDGRAQARMLARRLSHAGVTRIVSSDLSRCIDTVAPLGDATGLEMELEPRLREVANGDWTGLLPEEIAERWPDLWHRYRTGEDVERPGGERWADVRIRVRAVLEQVRDEAAGDDVIVLATHGGPTVLAVEWALGMTLPGNVFRGPIGSAANCGVATIDLAGPRLVGYNDVGHLERTLTDVEIPYAAVKEKGG